MTRIKFTDEILEKISIQAKSEDRTILGIIYSEYIKKYFPLTEIVNPQNVYATAKFISRLFELDKNLIGDEARAIYLQYAPSISSFKAVVIGENEMIIDV